jgi:beta-lactam-binding protein with PASTA domain
VPSTPNTVAVPNLVGSSESEALAVLKKVGLNAGQRTTKVDPDQVGKVLDQKPAAGKTVSVGTSVSLVIGVASTPVKVPSIVGQTLKDAREELKKSGLVVGRIEGPATDDSTVRRQDPSAESEVEAGAAVNLFVEPADEGEPDKDEISVIVERMSQDKSFAEIGASAAKIEKRLKKHGITTKDQLAPLLGTSDKDIKKDYGLPNLHAARAFKQVLERVLKSEQT